VAGGQRTSWPALLAAMAAPAMAPAPPQWRRPAGAAPRPFLVKGAGQLSCSPRAFHKVSRRSNSNGRAQINAATYSSREYFSWLRLCRSRWMLSNAKHVLCRPNRRAWQMGRRSVEIAVGERRS
jgi:hypothetical protein